MKPADSRRLIAAGSGLLAAWLLVNCGLSHSCVGGHLAHPERQVAERWLDATWVLLLILACGWAMTSNMRSRRIFYGLIFATVVVFQLLSSMFALPLTFCLAVFCVNAMRGGRNGKFGAPL